MDVQHALVCKVAGLYCDEMLTQCRVVEGIVRMCNMH